MGSANLTADITCHLAAHSPSKQADALLTRERWQNQFQEIILSSGGSDPKERGGRGEGGFAGAFSRDQCRMGDVVCEDECG